MRHIDTYHQAEPADRYTFVFDQQNPETGEYVMLPMTDSNWYRSQYIVAPYNPEGPNEHLGERVLFHTLGAVVMDHFFCRIAFCEDSGREG